MAAVEPEPPGFPESPTFGKLGPCSQGSAIRSIAQKASCDAKTPRLYVRRLERDRGARPGLTTEERDRLKALKRESRELRQVNGILRKGEPVKTPLVQAPWRTRFSRRRSSNAGSSQDRVH